MITACKSCILRGLECQYSDLKVSCDACHEGYITCVSLAVVHVFSDMQSSQVSSHNRNECVLRSVSALDDNFLKRDCFTSGFGIAHIGKSIQNHPRNNTLTNNGMSYSIVIICTLWNQSNCIGEELRALITPRCMYGKDRQDDQNCFKLCSLEVIEVLSKVELYCAQRFPEKIFRHKKEALNHEKIQAVTFIIHHPKIEVFYLVDSTSATIWVAKNSCIMVISSLKTAGIKSVIDGVYIEVNGKDSLIVCDASDDRLWLVFTHGSQKDKVVSVASVRCPRRISVNQSYDKLVVFSQANVSLTLFTLRILDEALILDFQKELKLYTDGILPILSIFMTDENSVLIISSTGTVYVTDSKLNEAKVLHCFDGDKYVKQGVTFNTYRQEIWAFARSGDSKMSYTRWEFSHFGLRLVRDSTRNDLCAALDNNSQVSYVSIKGDTAYLVCNNNEIWELGKMTFVIEYLKNAQKIYLSGGFVPKEVKAKDVERADLAKAISLLNESAAYFSQLTKIKQSIVDGTVVRGLHGTVYHVTTGCLEKTKTGLELVRKRIELLGCVNAELCQPHTLLNETGLEHSFGRSTIKNGTYNKSLKEYVSQKVNSEENFFFKICTVPFSNPCTYRKRYDEPKKVNLGIDTVLKVLKNVKRLQTDVYTLRSTADSDTVLSEAERVARSQPRRTNRSKWKESAGFKPMMLKKHPNCVLTYAFTCNDLIAVFDPLSSAAKFLFLRNNYTLNQLYLFGHVSGNPVDQWGPEEETDLVVRTSITRSISINTIIKDKNDCYFVFNKPLDISNRLKVPETFLKAIQDSIEIFQTDFD
ncbi:hypothetical protein ACHWQZ_G013566 [Mnemiopsis leidyi]